MRLMIIVGSVRPGRIGLPIARWVETQARAHEGVDEIDFVDLKELDLPFMDEPNHPRLHQYTQQHTIAWSERVTAADAVIVVMPEYNHSTSPVLKNAFDYLHDEWWRKPIGYVSYGGASGGTRSASQFGIITGALGMVRTGAGVELNFAGARISEEGFAAEEKEIAILGRILDELPRLSEALAPLR
jgi:NAD(P)H-dependent FMN reductase